ncbi:hypothetical protein ABZ517_10835 [Streptomyces scabiei]|uniref:hypothetical protein n=1 Tax=Streptomyces scabiei TaxID=1930 RepID=UPI0033E70C7C
METFLTVIVIIAVIAFGALLIHRLNSQHGDRIAAFHYGHSRMPVAGPPPAVPRKARVRGRTTGTGRRRDAGRGRLRHRLRRRTLEGGASARPDSAPP